MGASKTGRYNHQNGPRNLLSCALAYSASLMPEQREAKPKRWREVRDNEDPFTLEEAGEAENPFPPFSPDPNRARRIVCADGTSRPFALAPTRNDPLMDALLALNDATDALEMAQGNYVQFRDDCARADMDAAQVEMERLQREVAEMLTPGGSRER